MAFLTQGFAAQTGSMIGASGYEGFGMSTAAGSMNSSMGATTIGTGLAMGGQLLSGLGAYQAGLFQAKVAQNNAAIADNNAGAALAAGSNAEEVSRIKTGQEVGLQKAQAGASGVDVNVGSPVAVRNATQQVGDFDALAIRYNAARQAYGEQYTAATDRAQAGIDKTAALGGLLKGVTGAESSYFGGANSLASKWASMQLGAT